MEQTLVHIARDAAWAFVIVIIFAIIGVIAVIRWIVGLFNRAEHAVEAGVGEVERSITHRD